MFHAFQKVASHARLRAMIAVALTAMSVMVLVVALYLNFDQQGMSTQVIRFSADGKREAMTFRDYRADESAKAEQFYWLCLQRNEIFGDGTGKVCEPDQERFWCVSNSRTQAQLETCLK